MKKIWIRSCFGILSISTISAASIALSPRLSAELRRRAPEEWAELSVRVSRLPIAAVLEKIAEADLRRTRFVPLRTEWKSQLSAGEEIVSSAPIRVNQSLLPGVGETWVFDFERLIHLKTQKTPEMNLHLRGIYSISKRSDAENDYFVKLNLQEGGPRGGENLKLPLFQVSLDRDGKIERVFVMGRVKEDTLQEHWENLGKDLISNYFILEARSRMGELNSESKWMGKSLFEKTIYSYSRHPELKVDGSNHLAYFDESGLALVEGSERVSASDSSLFDQSQSYRMERVMITTGGIHFEKNGPAHSLGWGQDKKWVTGSFQKNAVLDSKKKRMSRGHAVAQSEDF